MTSETLQQIWNGLSLGAIYALIALGYTMVFGVLRFINFAHGDLLMIGGYAGIFLVAGQSGEIFSQQTALLKSAIGVRLFWQTIYLWALGILLVLALVIWLARGRKGGTFLQRPLYYLPLTTLGLVLFLPGLGRLMLGRADGNIPSVAWTIFVILSAMLICGFFGMTIERYCYRPLRSQPRITVLITAIGVSLLLESLAQWGFGAQASQFPPVAKVEALEISTPLKVVGMSEQVEYFDASKYFSTPIEVHPTILGVTPNTGELLIFAATAVVLLGLVFVVRFTKIGMAMRALAFNPTACSLMGVNTDFVIAFTFGLGSAMAGVAGVLIGIPQSIDPLMGVMFGLKAFVAAVVGGIGSLPGAVLGGLLIGLLETFAASSPTLNGYKDGVAFAALILILLIRPSGLLGKNIREKV